MIEPLVIYVCPICGTYAEEGPVCKVPVHGDDAPELTRLTLAIEEGPAHER